MSNGLVELFFTAARRPLPPYDANLFAANPSGLANRRRLASGVDKGHQCANSFVGGLMAFWIVYQGNSWKRARAGRYLWAPKIGKGGRPPQVYWSNMKEVRPGDIIYSGVDSAVRALSQASSLAYPAERPDPRDAEFWYGEGWRLDVTYTDLPRPLPYAAWVPAILAELPSRHSPFTRTGRPNQGYLFALPDSVGEYLMELASDGGSDMAALAHSSAPPPAGGETERQVLARARIGQGRFREDLMIRWKAQCAVSGVTRPELLRASHIKPWSSSNNLERLDPANGLLLSAAYDAAFDALLISFSDNGDIILADDFPAPMAEAAGIRIDAKLATVDDATRNYLVSHRKLVLARIARQPLNSPNPRVAAAA